MGVAMGLLEAYDAALQSRPLSVKLATAACINVLSDCVSQSLGGAAGGVPGVIRQCVVGVGITGIVHNWVDTLNHLFRRWPAGPHTVAAKTAFNMLFIEPAMVATYLGCSNLLQGMEVRDIAHELRSKLMSLTISAWSVWGPAAYLTYAYVPTRYHSLFHNALNFFYTTYAILRSRRASPSRIPVCSHCQLVCYDLKKHLCQKLTAKEMKQRLEAGNERYTEGLEQPHPHDPKARQKLINRKSMPAVAVVGCADSRCEPATLMDAIEGEMYVCRVAGNYVDQSVAGSVQFACQHLGTKCVMIFGHTKCGAIAAASGFDDPGQHKGEEPLVTLVRNIKAALDDKHNFGRYACKDDADKQLKAMVDKQSDDLVMCNVLDQMGIMRHVLADCPGVSILGSIFCIHSGKVEILDEYIEDSKLMSFRTGKAV
eukprot:TRINITY_DN91790_c0_g1_i1.p1 TRINITY_DN91790_c0_g1~~TRINITY_DN91790_c0_g1_i1.p1  ORF type:complete len:427 (+),score=80.70 TRINITY_DN91790_c0_g1_i1:70-1350(+)